jgi:HEAT repeat protein
MGFGEESVAVLIQVLLNKERPMLVRQRVGYLLGRIDSETESVVPALIQVLVDTQSFVRSAAASSLGKFGPDAKSEVLRIRRILRWAQDA